MVPLFMVLLFMVLLFMVLLFMVLLFMVLLFMVLLLTKRVIIGMSGLVSFVVSFIALFMTLFITLPFTANATVDLYAFDTDAQRQRYYVLIDELRCPKCQNQNLAGSNAEIAQDLRRELHRLLREGKTDTEIKAFMVARYGDFVLYQPPLNYSTLVLWLLPILLLMIGMTVLVLIVKYRRHEPSIGGLSTDDQLKLNHLLDDSHSSGGDRSV